jgi:hypothetical protein
VFEVLSRFVRGRNSDQLAMFLSPTTSAFLSGAGEAVAERDGPHAPLERAVSAIAATTGALVDAHRDDNNESDRR